MAEENTNVQDTAQAPETTPAPDVNTPAPTGNTDESVASAVNTPAEPANDAVLEVELTNGQVQKLTAADVQRMMERDSNYEGLQTQLGRYTNEIGDLRKKVSTSAQAPVTTPVQQNQPVSDFQVPQFTEEDLEDPRKLQEKMNTALRDALGNMNKSTQQFKQDILVQTQVDQVIRNHPSLKNVDKNQAYIVVDAAVALANATNAQAGTTVVDGYEAAIDNFYKTLGGGNPSANLQQSATKAMQNIVKSIRQAGDDTVPNVSSQGQMSGAAAEFNALSDEARVAKLKDMTPKQQAEFVKQLQSS